MVLCAFAVACLWLAVYDRAATVDTGVGCACSLRDDGHERSCMVATPDGPGPTARWPRRSAAASRRGPMAAPAVDDMDLLTRQFGGGYDTRWLLLTVLSYPIFLWLYAGWCCWHRGATRGDMPSAWRR